MISRVHRWSTRSRRSAAAGATGLSHRSPIAPVERPARAAYRQRNRGLPLRALPDAVFDQFFVSLSSNRDWAIVALAVSSGARAAELLGLHLGDLDVGRQLVALEGKGHHELQWVPTSPLRLFSRPWCPYGLSGVVRLSPFDPPRDTYTPPTSRCA